jgi:hypothetical protein
MKTVTKTITLFLLVILSGISSSCVFSQTWDTVSAGITSTALKPVFSLEVYNGSLYAGGHFMMAGSTPVFNLATWDGTTWASVGGGLDSTGGAEAFAVFNGNLYVGGSFTKAGGVPVNNIAKWNGTSWGSVGTGTNANILSLAVYNGNLYAGGTFDTAGGNPSVGIAMWNGTSWSSVSTGISNFGRVQAMTVYNGSLYVGGYFTGAGGIPASNIAKWDGTSWTNVGIGTNSLGVQALAVYNGNLYAGGSFDTVGGFPAKNIAKWNGTSWSPLGMGVMNSVKALTVYNGALYVGGFFTSAGGVAAASIAKYDGVSWNAVGAGVSFSSSTGTVNGLAVYKGNLYVGGGFTRAGGNPAVNIAQFWSGNLSVGSDRFICAGSNTTIGGSPTAQGGVPPYTYSWVPSSGLNLTNVSNPVANPISTTTYTLTVTDSTGGGTSITTLGSPASVTISINPLPTVTANASVDTICTGGTVTLTGSGANTYSWTGGVINGVAFSPTTTKTYTVTGTDGNGCTDTASKTIMVNTCAGIASYTDAVDVSIYPNPAPESLTVDVHLAQPEALFISIINVIGQEIFNQRINVDASARNIIYTGNLPTGVYSLNIRSQSGLTRSLKFAK